MPLLTPPGNIMLSAGPGTGDSPQLIIDTIPPGEALNSAFVKINDNFANIWAAGPVNSNINIANNAISTTNTNGNLVLNPNGIGAVIANAAVIPDSANVRDLGSTTLRWRELYLQYANVSGNLDISGSFNITGDLSIGGNLTVSGNIIEVGNIVTDSLTIQLANTAVTANAANGAGITVGTDDNIATILYDSSNNRWTTNIGISAGGPVTGTSLAVSSATIYGNLAAINGTFTGNVEGKQLRAVNGVVFNSQTVSESFTLDGYNAESVGPIDIATGVVIDITNGDWVIL